MSKSVSDVAQARAATQFDYEELTDSAAKDYGLEEFGADPFREFLERYVHSLNTGGAMTEEGVVRTRSHLMRCLHNRLDLRHWYGREPSIAAEVIDRPIFLMGLPRSGTTFMHHLFDHDPGMRLLRNWEALSPCPPPAIAPESIEPRLVAARAVKAATLEKMANFDAMHLLDPDGPDECTVLLDQVFGMVGVLNLAKVDGYFQWLADDADFRKVFAHHKRILQLLQYKAQPRRWVMKYPNYILSMCELSATYPDGLFVVSHRDPVQALASLCKLTHTLRASCYAEVDNDPHQVGQEIWDFVQKHVDRMMEFRTSNTAMPVVDIDYQQLLDDPSASVEKVYAAANMEFPQSVRSALAEWTAANPKGKRGKNTYRFEDYGLDRSEVEAGFDPYRQAFNIPRELS
jgi:Sulfotransferase family